MSDEDRLAALEKANAELRAELDALKPKPKPEFKVEPVMKRWDPTEGMSMDRATMAEFAAAASAGGIANDSWRRLEPSSIIPKPEVKEEPKAKGTGWQPERPLEMPPGVKVIDQMMDAENEMWRRDRAKQFGQAGKKEGE